MQQNWNIWQSVASPKKSRVKHITENLLNWQAPAVLRENRLDTYRLFFALVSTWRVPATVDECIWTTHANYFCENIDMTQTGHCLRQYWYVMYRLLTTVSFMTRTGFCLQLSIWRKTTTVYGIMDMIRTDCKYRILSGSRCVPGPWGLHASAPVMSSNTAVLSAWWCQQATLCRLLGEQEGGFPFKLRTVYYTGRFKKKSPLSVI
jgi:hypothetical protein